MKIKASSVLFLTVLAGVILLFPACEEENNLSQRRIRLVGDENLKLKEQLKNCNQQIGELKEVIAEYETEEQKRADTEKKMGDMVLKLLKDNDTVTKKIEKLTDENLQLKAGIAELESKLAESDDPQDSL